MRRIGRQYRRRIISVLTSILIVLSSLLSTFGRARRLRRVVAVGIAAAHFEFALKINVIKTHWMGRKYH